MADERIEIEVVLNRDGTKRSFVAFEKDVEASADKAGKSIERGIGSRTTALFSRLNLAVAGFATALAGAFAGRAVINAAIRQEDAVNSLNTALRLAGDEVDRTSEQIQAFASELQRTTTIGDETTIELFNLARTFTSSAEEAQRLTTAAIELNAATGISLDSAIKNLGRTFGGLTGELGEVLPQLRGLSQEALRSGAALDFVLQRFGGAAAAQVQTFSGATSQLSNAFGDLLEGIGFVVTRSPALINIINLISGLFARAADSVRGFAGSGDLVLGFVNGLASAAIAINQVFFTPLELGFNAIKLGLNAVTTAVAASVNGLIQIFSGLSSLISEDSELSQNLKILAQTTEQTFNDTAENTAASLDQIFGIERTEQINEFIFNLQEQIAQTTDLTNGLATTGVENVSTFANKTEAAAKKAEFALQNRVGVGISNTIQSLTKALVSGENAFEAFGRAILGTIGDLAIQLGQFFIIQGIAVEALKAISGAAAIAAGAALIALGTILKGISGGAGGLGGVAGGGGVAAPGTTTEGEPAGLAEEDEDEGAAARVTVNIQGDVLDSDDTGLRIVELINQSFDSEGGVLASV